MTEHPPHSSPAAPRWFNPWTAAAIVSAAILLTAFVAALLLTGWPIKASPLWSLGFTVTAVLAFIAAVVWAKGSVIEHIDRRDGRTSRQLETITTGLHQLGADVTFVRESTGDIRPVIVCAHAEALQRMNGHGLDPAVVEAANRLQGRVLPFDR